MAVSDCCLCSSSSFIRDLTLCVGTLESGGDCHNENNPDMRKEPERQREGVNITCLRPLLSGPDTELERAREHIDNRESA